MKLYIDISTLLSVNFLTGIQRVTREITSQLIKNSGMDIILLHYDREKKDCFDVIDTVCYLNYLENGIGYIEELFREKININELESGSIFFDIDGIWHISISRSTLYPVLKSNNIKIAVFVYDVVPIMYPQYVHQNTLFLFMRYFGAVLLFSDLIIVSAESTIKAIKNICNELDISMRNSAVIPLALDFHNNNSPNQKIRKKIQRIVDNRKYLLIVGTIEPRKNHAVVLDAFEERLFAMGLSLIFAGRIGWKIEQFKTRIDSHQQLDRKLFLINDANDNEIEYLYKHAYFTVMPSFVEGFGLPLVESINAKTPVIASDIPVFREVGGNFCDYFDPYNKSEFIKVVMDYLKDSHLYDDKKHNLDNYVRITWKESASMMFKVLKGLDISTDIIPKQPHQMVILSARSDILLETLPFIEYFMSFIKEIVVCCPDINIDEIRNRYNGGLKLIFLSDSKVLEGKPLPEDHTIRNFYLRCLALKSDIIEDVFIMSDDDYRPLYTISEDMYIEEGKYIAYYCFNIENWRGTLETPTSYDRSMYGTARFLNGNHYPTKQYSSHMPQIIDKRIFLEMLEAHKGIETNGYDEWSTYFNFGIARYPDKFLTRVYKTMCWPGYPTDWEQEVIPDDYLFENYYSELYNKGKIFDGFSRDYNKDIVKENRNKISLFMRRQHEHEKGVEVYKTYKAIYGYLFRESPAITIVYREKKAVIYLPKFFVFAGNHTCSKIAVTLVYMDEEEYFQGRLTYQYISLKGHPLSQDVNVAISNGIKNVDLPVYGLKYRERCSMFVSLTYDDIKVSSSVEVVFIIDEINAMTDIC
jgi:glycosyltransferase involved in cell wall biosynthesis